MRIIFLGTPEFAVPTLNALIDDARFSVVAVVSQPDRPAGRGNKLCPTPTKLVALKHDIPVWQPERLSKSPETLEKMVNLTPDLIVTVAFGQILRKPVLTLPKYGIINVHASLLPAYRGAAPINWAIINGETATGVTTVFTEAGLDTGPMLLKQEVPIDPDTTSEELAAQLSKVGARLLIDTLIQLQHEALKPIPQDDSLASLAPMLAKNTGHIDWQLSADKIHNLVRGLLPWPAAYTHFKGAPLKILKTALPIGVYADHHIEPGAITIQGDKVLVACGSSGLERLLIVDVQPANKARMRARDWANGVHLISGERFEVC